MPRSGGWACSRCLCGCCDAVRYLCGLHVCYTAACLLQLIKRMVGQLACMCVMGPPASVPCLPASSLVFQWPVLGMAVCSSVSAVLCVSIPVYSLSLVIHTLSAWHTDGPPTSHTKTHSIILTTHLCHICCPWILTVPKFNLCHLVWSVCIAHDGRCIFAIEPACIISPRNWERRKPGHCHHEHFYMTVCKEGTDVNVYSAHL